MASIRPRLAVPGDTPPQSAVQPALLAGHGFFKEYIIMTYVQFSSFQIGKMLNVSRQAVNQWIDKGYIKSYRTPGGHRRVKRDDLINFLKTRNIPIPESLEVGAVGEPSPSAPLHIMLLDADQDFLASLEQAIRGELPSTQISRFQDGYDALVAVGAHSPDLLVLDLDLPNIDGLEVCRRLKDNPLTSALPIIVLSRDPGSLGNRLSGFKVDQVMDKSTPLPELATGIARLTRDDAVG